MRQSCSFSEPDSLHPRTTKWIRWHFTITHFSLHERSNRCGAGLARPAENVKLHLLCKRPSFDSHPMEIWKTRQASKDRNPQWVEKVCIALVRSTFRFSHTSGILTTQGGMLQSLFPNISDRVTLNTSPAIAQLRAWFRALIARSGIRVEQGLVEENAPE